MSRKRFYSMQELFGENWRPPSDEPYETPKSIALIRPDGSYRVSAAHSPLELLVAHLQLLERFEDGDMIEIKDIRGWNQEEKTT